MHKDPVIDRALILPPRPSLFSNNSKSTEESNLSLREEMPFGDHHLGNSENSISDISEVEDDLAHIDLTQNPSAGQSDMLKGSRRVSATSQPNRMSHDGDPSKANIFFILNSPSLPVYASSLSASAAPPPELGLDRRESLFGSRLTLNSKIKADAASVSSTDISEDDDSDYIDDDEIDNHDLPSLLMNENSRSNKSTKIVKSMDDTESEWMSVSSDGDPCGDSPKVPPITFAKRIPTSRNGQSAPSSIVSDSKSSSPFSSKPRSLLSGLLMNGARDLLASSPTSSKSVQCEIAPPKPLLKRSSTTGVITVDKSNKTKDARGLQKPSLLLSKRYGSLTDVTRNMTSQRSPVLYVTSEETEKDGAMKSDEDSLFAKQTSSVGLSDFMVMADGNRTLGPESSRQIKKSFTEPDEVSLSSSLSKYSALHQGSNRSLKNLLSKSSMNITSFLGQGFSGKLRMHYTRSYETLKSLPETAEASLFAGYLSQRHSAEALRAELSVPLSKSVKVEAKAMKDFNPSVALSLSLKESVLIDHKLGKVPMPDRVISDEDLFSGHDKNAFVDEPNDYHSKGW